MMSVMTVGRCPRGPNAFSTSDALRDVDFFIMPICRNEERERFAARASHPIKYGALSNLNGKVDIVWTEDSANAKPHLCWSESGGPPVNPSRQLGFGSKLVKALAQDIAGEVRLDFEPDGARCVIRANLKKIGALAEETRRPENAEPFNPPLGRPLTLDSGCSDRSLYPLAKGAAPNAANEGD